MSVIAVISFGGSPVNPASIQTDPSADDGKVYTEDELNAMTVEQIKALAKKREYTITKTVKAEIITEFLAAQTAAQG